jgi:hypothetical protein
MTFIAVALLIGSCAGCGFGLNPADNDALAKLRAGTHELVAKEDLSKLRNVGRYQILPLGARAWRLDTATGDTCLMFASDQDWKDQKFQGQSCQQ